MLWLTILPAMNRLNSSAYSLSNTAVSVVLIPNAAVAKLFCVSGGAGSNLKSVGPTGSSPSALCSPRLGIQLSYTLVGRLWLVGPLFELTETSSKSLLYACMSL